MSDFADNIIDNAATITATATSPTFIRPAATGLKKVVFLARLGAAPTGTSPTLTYKLQSSMDGTVWHDVASTSAMNTNGQTARLEAYALEPYWQVVKTIGGSASPTFTLVTSRIIFPKD